MYNHQTIRRYMASLLNILGKLKIQNFNSSGDLIEKNIPVVFFNREKSSILDHISSNNMMINVNAIPRAYLTVDAIMRDDSRILNRNIKIHSNRVGNNVEYQYNSTPFTYTLSYIVICRGHGEATQIIEEVVPIFNPTLALDVYDCDGLKEPTRVLVKFLDVGIEPESNEPTSSNLITLTFGLELQGYIYQPIRSVDHVKELIMRYHTKKDCFAYDYDVDVYPNTESRETLTKLSTNAELSIKGISGNGEKGMCYFTLNYTYQKGDQVQIDWKVIDGDAKIIETNNEKCQVLVKGEFMLTAKIVDFFNNEVSYTKYFKM